MTHANFTKDLAEVCRKYGVTFVGVRELNVGCSSRVEVSCEIHIEFDSAHKDTAGDIMNAFVAGGNLL